MVIITLNSYIIDNHEGHSAYWSLFDFFVNEHDNVFKD